MRREALVGRGKLVLETGDITEVSCDAVVNAANSSLMGGGGVDGAIHRAGGPAILEECRETVAVRGRLPAGEAVATTGGDLAAQWVIHTVGPIWRGGGGGERDTLAQAYRSCLEVARRSGIGTLAFPSISTGAYGYPVDEAARVAVSTVVEELYGETVTPAEIRFVLYDAGTYEAYSRALDLVIGW
jgi:O-acetyl-ADP-ribose deacetylase